MKHFKYLFGIFVVFLFVGVSMNVSRAEQMVALSQSNVTVGVGQSTNITVSGSYGSLGIYNATTSAFQTVLAGNTLTISGMYPGGGTVSICSMGYYGCSTLTVTVTGNALTGQVVLDPSSLTLWPFQARTVTISSGCCYFAAPTYYVLSNSNPNVATATINASSLSVETKAWGSTTITVCQIGTTSLCANLPVQVSDQISAGPLVVSQSTVALGYGKSATITISGGSGTNYIAYNSNASSVQATMSGTTLQLLGLNQTSNTVVVVCNTGTNCAAVTVSVTSSGVGENLTYCAAENGYCYFSGTRQVRYGANGSYYYKTFTNGVACTNANFGDPIFGTVKQCYY